MDESLAKLLPSHRIGSDGFSWWIGQVEDLSANDPKVKGNFRYKVRIVGEHTKQCEVVGKDDLPWATVLMPVTAPMSAGGPVQGAPNLYIGCWVMGFYMDPEKQKPMIMGAIPQLIGATGKINDYEPGECNAFKTWVFPQNDPYTVGPSKIDTDTTESGQVAQTEPGTDQTDSSGAPSGEDSQNKTPQESGTAPKAGAPLREFDDLAAEKICATLPDGCGKEASLGENMNIIIGDLLKEIQQNNGKIGTALVNKATGKVGEVTGIATKYIGKAIALVQKLVAKVKGIVINGLKLAVDALVKAVLRQDESGNALTPITQFFNKLLKQLGCSMADIGERLADFLTNLLMGYIEDVYKMAACQLDLLVNGILNRIQSELNGLIGDILGFIQGVLGPIGSALNIVGGAISQILSLLGITCSGGDRSCQKWRKACVDGDDSEDEEKEDNFLDKLLEDLENGIDGILPNQGYDYNVYTCPAAYEGNDLKNTNIGFIGGTLKQSPPKDKGAGGENDPPGSGDANNPVRKQIVYEIDDVDVSEGEIATFTITRSGDVNRPSSIKFKTFEQTAKENTDYLPKKGIIPFQAGQTTAKIDINTIEDKAVQYGGGGQTFYVYISLQTPKPDYSFVDSIFKKNSGVCHIWEKVPSAPIDTTMEMPTGAIVNVNNPFAPKVVDPITVLDSVFIKEEEPDPTTGDVLPSLPTVPDLGNLPNDNDLGGSELPTATPDPQPIIPDYQVVANKSSVGEGGTIRYTITTQNVLDDTTLSYTLSGTGITADDIVGDLTGTFTIQNNGAIVEIEIAEDSTVEQAETLNFSIDNTSAGVSVIIDPDGTTDGVPVDPEEDDDDDDDGETPTTPTTNEQPYYYLTVDDTTRLNGYAVAEGGFVTFIIKTANVPDNTNVPWIITGDVSTEDITGGVLKGNAFIQDGIAKVIVGIEEDTTVEQSETLTFTLMGKGKFINVTILSTSDLLAPDEDFEPTNPDPTLPEAGDPITDENGGIISIPVLKPGDPYVDAPYVAISGLGYGATGEALIDGNGFVTEIRVTNAGFGYKLNTPENAGLRCIIDSFTIVTPGFGYTSQPTVWVDGRNDVAEALIDDEGRVVSVRVLDRVTTFDGYPEVLIIGGGGQGAKWIPSFACLDTEALAEIGSTKIGTGKYIDCP